MKSRELNKQNKGRASRPLRTCCVCRVKTLKSELIRFVLEEGIPVEDACQNRAGRGAYCCRDGCGVDFLKQQKRWKKAFKTERGSMQDVMNGKRPRTLVRIDGSKG